MFLKKAGGLPRKKIILISALSFLVLVVGRLCIFSEPFGVSVDESGYLAMAESVNTQGVVYESTVDRKPPGLIWAYALVAKIFGDWNLAAIQISFIGICFLLGLVAVFITGSWLALPLYAFFSSSFPREIVSANAEYLMMLPLVVSIWLFLRRNSGREKASLALLFFTAVLAALSTLFKQYSALVYAPLYIFWAGYYLLNSQQNLVEKVVYQLKAAIVSAMGLAVVYGLCYFYFWSNGAEDSFVFYSLINGLQYIGEETAALNQKTSFHFSVIGMLVAWFPMWILVGWGIVRKDFKNFKSYALFIATFGAISTAFLSGRYYTHYFIPAIWFVAVLSSLVLSQLWVEWSIKKKLALCCVGVMPFLFFAIFNFDRDRFTESWSFNKKKQFQIYALSAWIQSQTQPADRISVWGYASQIYVKSQRGSGTRYSFADFVSGRLPGLHSSVSQPIPGSMKIYLSDLQQNKPKLFIDTSTVSLNDYQYFPPSRYPDLYDYLVQNYENLGRVQGFQVWKRN